MRAKIVTDGEGLYYGIRIVCPHCGPKVLCTTWCPPGLAQSAMKANRPHWDFNGNFALPSLNPSILTNRGPDDVCHSFVKDGAMQFLSDCTHPMAGQTVALPEVEDSHAN